MKFVATKCFLQRSREEYGEQIDMSEMLVNDVMEVFLKMTIIAETEYHISIVTTKHVF